MSEENRQVVLRGHAARTTGRFRDWIETLDPDIEWDISGYPVAGFPRTGSGRDQFVAHVTTYWSLWNDYSQDVKEMIEEGDDVVVVLREHARLRKSDADLEREIAAVWTIKNGKRVRYRVFASREDALRAVRGEGARA